MKPQIKSDLYCFDSTQVRKIAQVVKDEPLKDSLIKEQTDQIHDLKSLSSSQDSTIKTQSRIIENDSLRIEKLETVVELQDEKHRKDLELNIKQTRKKARKPLLISIGVNILLFIGYLAK